MSDVAAEHVQTKNGQRDQKHVEEAIVAFAHTVGYPRTMMVEFLDTIVADAAVRGPRRPVQFASETVLELDGFAFHDHFFVARHLHVVGHLLVRSVQAGRLVC